MSYVRYQPDDLVISAESITGTVWSDNNPTLTSFFLNTNQVNSETGDYYYNVNQSTPTAVGSQVQFAIAYADKDGSGSVFYNSQVTGSSPTRVIYGQYRTLVLGDENAQFVFGDVTGSYFHVLSIERAGYKESLFPGTFNLLLSGSGNQTLHLTDNSVTQNTLIFNDAGRVYQVISGSNGSPYINNGYTPNSASYGLFLPDIGTIILNSEALNGSAVEGGLEMPVSRSFDIEGNNPNDLFLAISGGASFALNSQETITSDFIFTRARNAEFNYSENPSYISGSSGELVWPIFIDSPQTYITCIGLYNDSNELLAVAKLSRPLLKDFTKELLVRVKLDF